MVRNNVITVGEMAGKDYRMADVFRGFGIDFCCGGGQTIAQAATQGGITEEELWTALETAALKAKQPASDFSVLAPQLLAEHILSTHHKYVKEALPVIWEFAQKVAGHHGDTHPELIDLRAAVLREAEDLLDHLEKEEQILFPAIKQMAAGETGLPYVKGAVESMMKEHSSSGESLEEWRRLTNNYQVPEGACNSYRFLFEKLQEFDTDLRQHIHLENNILFPKALAMLQEA
ncbi:iron-sulfur cluster repair di-iron protein [Chitinophaga sp. LS1]|uniref:iron-sulfur cluster repair di-iron protein n=1 Tax=Chitinophaga sp. LS1 TaxID=3051176 RepID=UPI002AABD9F8|nr:iron-sulfur cluster repair di-iron protein [Chitinophaga sp. LS1]WPV70473.1 iron-sulfur cluster repair di-iron protein [Chitinophaga sp. LS1]